MKYQSNCTIFKTDMGGTSASHHVPALACALVYNRLCLIYGDDHGQLYSHGHSCKLHLINGSDAVLEWHIFGLYSFLVNLIDSCQLQVLAHHKMVE